MSVQSPFSHLVLGFSRQPYLIPEGLLQQWITVPSILPLTLRLIPLESHWHLMRFHWNPNEIPLKFLWIPWYSIQFLLNSIEISLTSYKLSLNLMRSHQISWNSYVILSARVDLESSARGATVTCRNPATGRGPQAHVHPRSCSHFVQVLYIVLYFIYAAYVYMYIYILYILHEIYV